MSTPAKLPRRSFAKPDPEMWRPSWKCFCCEDSGWVAVHLIRHVIPDYSADEDQPVVCRRPGCDAGIDLNRDTLAQENFVDWRFEPSWCAELDKISRTQWRDWRDEQFHRRRMQLITDELAQAKSLRSRKRSGEEAAMAQGQHQVVLAALEVEAESDNGWEEF